MTLCTSYKEAGTRGPQRHICPASTATASDFALRTHENAASSLALLKVM